MRELYAIDKATLVAIADAIREKKLISGPIPVGSFASEILGISVGGNETTYTIPAGSYIDKDSTIGDYENLPYPYYYESADVRGELSVSGVNQGEFTRISISGYGLEMDDSRYPEGAPYPEIRFYNGDTQTAYIDASCITDVAVELSIFEPTEVSVPFCIAFWGLFRKA
jgi:hypothetical protein